MPSRGRRQIVLICLGSLFALDWIVLHGDLMNREKGRGKRYPLTASTEAGLAAPLEMKLWQNLGYWEVFRLDVQVWGLKCVKICLHRWAKSPDNGLAVMNI